MRPEHEHPSCVSKSKAAWKNIVILTGAGVSRESGVRTFRDADGIWAKVRIEDVATPEAFERDPQQVHAFYNERRRKLLDASVQPNDAHRALVALEKAWQGDFLLVTQNIDDLHQRAGSRSILPMHGELLRGRCAHCGEEFVATKDLSPENVCASCGRSGGLRPHIVWFGEVPLGLDTAFAALRRCDVFAAIGTSGAVYPAAQFVSEAAASGAHTFEINLEPSDNTVAFAERIHGPATETVPAWVIRLLREENPAEETESES